MTSSSQDVVKTSQGLPLKNQQEIALNNIILAMNDIPELLGLFANFKNSPPMVQRNRSTVLRSIAKIVHRAGRQRAKLIQQFQGKQEFDSLLDHLLLDICHSTEQDLAHITWSLGKLGEKNHPLIEACEKEILSLKITSFSLASLNQILGGFASLNMKNTKFFETALKAMLKKDICISDFENKGLVGSLWSLSKTGNGSVALFELYRREIEARDISTFQDFELCLLAYVFAKQGLKVKKLFSYVEEKIFHEGLVSFTNVDMVLVLCAFAMHRHDGTYSHLFNCLDTELISRGIHSFSNSELAHIVWSFTKEGVKEAKVYNAVKEEILQRGLEGFRNHLSQLLWAYAELRYPCFDLYHKIAVEVQLSDKTHLNNKVLSQYAFYCGKVGISNAEVYQSIEKELFQRDPSKLSYDQVKGLLQGFVWAKQGSKQLFQFLETAVMSRGVSTMNSVQVSNILCLFAKGGVKASKLNAEIKKIIGQGKSEFSSDQLEGIKRSLQIVSEDTDH